MNNKGLKIIIAICLCFFISISVSAQTCLTVLKSKTGKVFSARPAIIKTTSPSNQATITIKKTGGRAETQVNIYVGGQYKGKLEFDAGRNNYPQPKKFTVNNALNKEIKIEIMNQSVANTFDYNLEIKGRSKSLTKKGGMISGVLAGSSLRTLYTNASCTGKLKIILTRKRGNNEGEIRIYEKEGSRWANRPKRTTRFPTGPSNKKRTKTIEIESNKQLKIKLLNDSPILPSTITYSIEVIVSN